MTGIEKRLAELGLEMPAPPKANGLYEVCRIEGDRLHTSGQLSRLGDEVITGCLSEGDSLDEARRAARICALRCLSVIKAAVGDLDRIDRVISVRGFVSSHPGFRDHSAVLDAASALLLDILGERGRHLRTAVGVSGLPSGGLLEVEMSVALR